MFSNLSNMVSRHSKAVVIAWLVVLVASLYFVPQSGDVLVYDMTEMSGSQTERPSFSFTHGPKPQTAEPPPELDLFSLAERVAARPAAERPAPSEK